MKRKGTADWMTPEELMKEVGMGRTAFYNAVRLGELPIKVHKFGGRYLFSRREWERLQGIPESETKDCQCEACANKGGDQ